MFWTRWFARKPRESVGESPPAQGADRPSVSEILNSEALQNAAESAAWRAGAGRRPSVDEAPDGVGAFGRDPRNPAPVNGTRGALVYLSTLSAGAAEFLFFHRLGRSGALEAYEAVSSNGKDWAIFYLDTGFPRRSRRAPEGFRAAAEGATIVAVFGADKFVDAFPEALPAAIEELGPRLFGGAVLSPSVNELLARNVFTRPEAHAQAVRTLLEKGF